MHVCMYVCMHVCMYVCMYVGFCRYVFDIRVHDDLMAGQGTRALRVHGRIAAQGLGAARSHLPKGSM